MTLPSSPLWLQTERLALRRFTPDDLEWLVELYSDADVMRFLGGVQSRAKVEEIFEARIMRYYDAHPGLGIWVTVDRLTRERLGLHLLNHIQGEVIIQVGFILAKAAWGRGIATEMASALLRYGFGDLRLPRICGMTELGNLVTQRVLQKIGLERRGERAFPHPAYRAAGPLAWFERDAADWPPPSVA